MELQEAKKAQLEEEKLAKEEIEKARTQMLHHRDDMLQKLWTSQNEVQQLRSLNKEIFGEIESMKSTIQKQEKRPSHHNSCQSPGARRSPSKRSGYKSSKNQSTDDKLQPVVAQLNNIASNCKSKLNSISSLQGSMESLTISKEALKPS